jgi:hypothetical protein
MSFDNSLTETSFSASLHRNKSIRKDTGYSTGSSHEERKKRKDKRKSRRDDDSPERSSSKKRRRSRESSKEEEEKYKLGLLMNYVKWEMRVGMDSLVVRGEFVELKVIDGSRLRSSTEMERKVDKGEGLCNPIFV